MSRKQKKMLWRIGASAAMLLAFGILDHLQEWKMALALPLFLIPYLIIGYDVLWRSIRNIGSGQLFDENFLMSLATVGAFATSQYEEAVFVMLFYQIGEFFEHWAVNKSRGSIAELMDISPEYANLERDGELVEVDPAEVSVNDTIVVKPGERVPLDGEIVEGVSSLNTVALTGESLPRDVVAGDRITSGCVNISGVIKVKVLSRFEDSTVSRILELIEDASSNKAVSEDFITRFSRYYTPLVVISAVLLAFIPPIFVGDLKEWVMRALTFLVISCPCALVISVPLSFFGGIGAASRRGILVKGSCFLEALAKCEVAVFDKTGTLTEGSFKVTGVYPRGFSKEAFMKLAASAEGLSNHPIARSVRQGYGKEIDLSTLSSVEELAGFGISALVEGKKVLAGNDKLMDRFGIGREIVQSSGTILHLAVDGVYAGYITIEDTIRAHAASLIRSLGRAGCRSVMLTGDKSDVARSVAGKLGLDEVHAELLPSGKVERVETLFKSKSEKGKLLFVGDGINDAPVLARADIGIAMGGIGSDASIEAADVVIMDDDIGKLETAMLISRRTLSIVKQNIVFAIGIKLLFLALGALGLSNMWMAVFADVGVSFLAILNAMRTLRADRKPLFPRAS